MYAAFGKTRAICQVPDALEQQFETDVDRILEKISTLGAESLTPQERRILELASQRYKRRRS